MKIIQIMAHKSAGLGNGENILGLGDDGLVYQLFKENGKYLWKKLTVQLPD